MVASPLPVLLLLCAAAQSFGPKSVALIAAALLHTSSHHSGEEGGRETPAPEATLLRGAGQGRGPHLACVAAPCLAASPLLSLGGTWCHCAAWRSTAYPIPIHPHPHAGELWIPLACLEIHPSCDGGSETQVPWIGSNCSHQQKVSGKERNVLLKGQKLDEVEGSPGHHRGVLQVNSCMLR